MRSSLSRLTTFGACLAAAAAVALPASAGAAGYHMSRDFSANGDSATAHGKLCGSSSKYGDWRWHVTVGSGALEASYRWIEPVRADGKARNLEFTDIGGQIVDDQPAGLQAKFVAAVKRVLNKITVRAVAGGSKLAYETPTNGKSTVPFHPARGC
jgi:hypothetical protein